MHVSRYIITSHFHRWEGTSNPVFCMHFESWSWQKWHDVTLGGLIDAIRSSPCLPHVSKECDETLQQQWMSLVAAQYSIHILRLRGYPDSVICMQLRVETSGNDTMWNHNGITYALRSSSHPSHTSKEGYEALQQQCMSIIVSQHLISPAERVPQIWYFVCTLRVGLGRNDMMWPLGGS